MIKTLELKQSLDELAKLERIKSDLSTELKFLDATTTSPSAIRLGTGCNTIVVRFSSETTNYIRDEYRVFLTDMIQRVEASISNLEVS